MDIHTLTFYYCEEIWQLCFLTKGNFMQFFIFYCVYWLQLSYGHLGIRTAVSTVPRPS